MSRQRRRRLQTFRETNDMNASSRRHKSTGNGKGRQDLNLTTPDSKTIGSCETTIENLPNEILLLIFKELEWYDVMENVNRVCRRWREISMHYSVWMDKRIISPKCDMLFENILRTAPVLGELDLTRTEADKSTLEVLLRSTTRIRKLYINVDYIERTSHHLVVPLLRHLSANLETLELEWYTTEPGWSKEDCMLGSMPKLKNLAVYGKVSLNVDINRLMPCSPILENLSLDNCEGIRDYYYDPELDSDSKVIIKNNETLKSLFILNRADLRSVAECRQLTTIGLPIEYVEVVSHLPNIESLEIICMVRSFPKAPQRWCCPKNLKQLRVCFWPSYDRDWIRFLRDIQPPALTVDRCEFSEELAESLSPQIKSLSIRHCSHKIGLDYLKVLLRNKSLVPNLEYLSVPHSVRPCIREQRGIFTDLREAFPSTTIE